MKKLICITGSRAEFGVLKELLLHIAASEDFDLGLIVTGMHLSEVQGRTLDEVRASGLRIAGVVEAETTPTHLAMAHALGQEISGIADILAREDPAVVLVTGDRGEALAGAAAAAYLTIPVAHISGGDVTKGGAIDDRVRHAITAFADIHFAETAQSARNLIAKGVDPARVFAVGNPGLGATALPESQKAAVLGKYDLNRSEPILLVLQHPVTAQAAETGAQMRETLAALRELKHQTVLLYPNSDAGSTALIEEIEAAAGEPYLRIFKHVPREEFLALLSVASVIVGNSSAALVEAPAFNLPAVNIGTRQQGRERAGNGIDAPHERSAIIAAIRHALSNEFRASLTGLENPYMKSDTIRTILSVLARYASP